MSDELSPRFQALFFEVYEALPRQGPGDRASATRALGLCGALPPSPAALDLGCGVGGQTLYLAELTAGRILALDTHAPSIERLRATLAERGLAHRVEARVADMAEPGLAPASFDLVWSEGALYNIGLDRALRNIHALLRPGGHLVFTDAVWRKEDPPAEVRAGFDQDYPAMAWTGDVLATIERHDFAVLGHFTLPDEAWWTDFYTPMLARIEALRRQHAGDAEAAGVLDQLAREPELHRLYSDYYAYEYFVARRPA
jgi:SAM-dependent methyltransferase